MPGIDNIGSLFTRLGRQLGRTRAGAPTKTRGTGNRSDRPAQEADLQSVVRQKLTGIDTAGAGRARARKLFIEAALAWEFGESILLDPGLQELVQGIEADFAADRDLAAELDLLLNDLAGNKPR